MVNYFILLTCWGFFIPLVNLIVVEVGLELKKCDGSLGFKWNFISDYVAL